MAIVYIFIFAHRNVILKTRWGFIEAHPRPHGQVTAEHYEVFKVDWMKQRIIR